MSMIEQLRENIPNSNVYVAKNNINHIEMIKLGKGDYSTKVSVSKITETDKHSIIVFESSSANTNAFHDIAYEELHKLVDKVIFDYKHTTGSIPKINLIAHSRGGILNMMYANDHPQLIDSIFSLGTPYNGSNIGSLGVYLNDNFDAKIKSAGDSAKDIVNVEKQAELRANWEQTLVKNPAINAYALGGIMNVNAFYDLINSAKSKVGETGIINSLLVGAETLVGKIESYPLLANGLIDILNIFQNFAVFIMESIVAENADNNSDVQNEYLLTQLSNIVYDVLDSFKAEFNGEWYQIFDKKKYTSIYADDGLVEIGSQLAQGFSGFTRYVKMYDNTYEHKDKLSTGTFLAGHNYEPRDPELIKYVIDRIDMVSDPIFELTREGNGLSVLGVKNNVTMPNVLSIPNDIAGVPVKCIRADAFNNIGGRFNNVTELRIPTTVNKIEFGAIIGLGLDVVELNDNPNFIYQNGALLSTNNADGQRIIFFNTKATNNTYAIPSSVKGLDAYSFYNAKNFSSIVLHSDLEYIEVGAFKNAAIASVSGASDRLYYIAEEAFEGTPYLLNSNFVLVGQSLIKYNGNELSLSAGDFPAGIKSIAANAFFGSAINSVVLPNSIEYIGVQAFMNSSLKNIVLGNNILSISERAFANCYQLEEVTIEFNNANRLRYGVFSYCGDASIIVPKQYKEDFISAESLKGQISNIESRTVTVRFDTVGGEVVDQMSVDFGSILSGMPTPIKTGYTFDGWYASSEYQGIKYTNGEYWDKYADTTLFARWTANECLLSFNHDGTSITTPIVVIYDAAIGGLPIPIKGGNTFAGWYNSSDIEITKDTIWKETENVTVNARWIKNAYTANFDLNGGIGDCNSVEVVYGNMLEFDYAPVRRGNIFKGWSFSENSFSKINSGTSYNWTNDITLIACWELIEYTISYDLNGVGVTNDNNNVYTVESEEILLLNAARFGYLFLGWYIDGVKVTKIDAASIGNKNLKAEWDGVEVGVILNSNEGTLTGANEIDLEFGSIFELTVPIRSGHYFDGWYIGDKKYTDKEGVSLIFWDEIEAQTLVANWIKESYEIKILNNGGFIWVDENGDFSSNEKRIPYGTEFTGHSMINFIAIFKVTYGYRDGMIFEHFHANAGNNDLCEFLENGNNDITHLFALGTIGDLGDDGAVMLIYPKWQRENYTIYFDDGASSIFAKYGEPIQLPNKNMPHYVFNGWINANGNSVNWITMPDLTPSAQSNGSTELVTSKTAIKYNISYELYGGAITSRFSDYKFDYTYGSFMKGDFRVLSESEKMFPYFSDGIKLLNKDVLDKYGYAMAAGEMPKSDKEFCISKLIADKLIEFNLVSGVNDYDKFIGIVYDFKRFGNMKLVGILDTGDQTAIDNILSNKKFVSQESRIAEEVGYTFSRNLLVNSDFIKYKVYNIKTNRGTIKHGNYAMFGQETIKTSGRVCDIKFAEEFRGSTFDTIVYASGVTSLRDNEIIVEKSIVEAMTSAHFGISRVTEEQIVDFLNTKPEFADFEIGEGGDTKFIEARIVGYHEYADLFNKPLPVPERIIIVDEDMVKREINNIGVLSMQTVMSGNSKSDIALIKGMRELGYEVSSYFSYDIVDAKHNTNVFKTLGMAIAGAFAIFSALMMFNFISSSIKTNKKQIGVLRAIGMSTGKVSFIFLFESLILCLMSFILSLACVFPIANALAYFGSNYIVAIKNFIIDFPVIIAMLGLSIFVGIMGSLVPVWRKARVSPVKLIRD